MTDISADDWKRYWVQGRAVPSSALVNDKVAERIRVRQLVIERRPQPAVVGGVCPTDGTPIAPSATPWTAQRLPELLTS